MVLMTWSGVTAIQAPASRGRVVLWLLAAFLGACLLLAKSRGGTLGLGAGLLVVYAIERVIRTGALF